MDHYVALGSQMACGTLHMLGVYSLEMDACGSQTGRDNVGLLTLAAVLLLMTATVCRLAAART